MKPLFVTVNEFKNDYGYRLFIKTVRRYIYKCDTSNYAAVAKPYICPRHILARKQWANMHRKWDLILWAKVAFSDESTLNVRPTTQRKRV